MSQVNRLDFGQQWMLAKWIEKYAREIQDKKLTRVAVAGMFYEDTGHKVKPQQISRVARSMGFDWPNTSNGGTGKHMSSRRGSQAVYKQLLLILKHQPSIPLDDDFAAIAVDLIGKLDNN